MIERKKHQLFMASLLLVAFALFCLCFASCSQTEESELPGDGVAVGFTLPGLEGAVTETEAATRGNLAENTKVRVVVYKNGAQSSANYVTEKVYTVQANGTLSATDGDLRLIEGSYDFYAITPALTVDHSGTSPKVTVSQKTDFACSLTTGQKITKWSSSEGSSVKRSIALTELERKCALLAFKVEMVPNISVINRIVISKVSLDRMARQPLTVTGVGNLPAAAANDYTLSAGSSFFTTEVQNARKATGSFTVLPKTSETFSLGMEVLMNGATSTPVVFEAKEIEAFAFVKGYKYQFTVTLTKTGAIGLYLTISKWTDHLLNPELGGNPETTVQLGEWTDITWEETTMGGNPEVTLSKVSGWHSFDWEASLGEDAKVGLGSVLTWTGTVYNPTMGSDTDSENQ
ncbi:BF2992 family fimbrillin-A clan protein [Bacteroides sp.]